MFVGLPNFTVQSLSGVAVGVPGMVRGTALAIENYGRLPLAQVLQPAIQLAGDGFAATPRFVTSPNCSSAASRAKNSPLAAEYFCPGGNAIPAGTLVKNEPLAQTFRLIAQHGADCFYKVDLAKGCDIALGIVEGQKWTRTQGDGRAGSMTLADLEAYQPAIRQPIEGSYRGYRIKSMAPPSSGALTVIQILKLLERFPLGDASKGFGFGATNTLNVMADAMRLAFADRAVWMADADFVPVPAKGLIDDTYLAGRGAGITPGARLLQTGVPPEQAGTLLSSDPRPFETAGLKPGVRLALAEPGPGNENGTTHFSVVDKWGNVVSYTNTIESGYGIGVFAGYTPDGGGFRNFGFLLNNELTDFNTAPTTNPWTGGRLQRRAAEQAPAQQHGADDAVLAAGQADPGLRLAGRGDDHQLGGQHHGQPGRPQDGAAAGRRRGAHLGGQRRQRRDTGKPLPGHDRHGAGGPGLHRRHRRRRFGAGGADRLADRQAVRCRR